MRKGLRIVRFGERLRRKRGSGSESPGLPNSPSPAVTASGGPAYTASAASVSTAPPPRMRTAYLLAPPGRKGSETIAIGSSRMHSWHKAHAIPRKSYAARSLRRSALSTEPADASCVQTRPSRKIVAWRPVRSARTGTSVCGGSRRRGLQADATTSSVVAAIERQAATAAPPSVCPNSSTSPKRLQPSASGPGILGP